MKHRTLALMLAAAMLIALPACGSDDGGTGPSLDSDSPAVTDPADPDESPSSSAPVESDQPSDSPEPSGAPSDSPEPSDEPSDSPSPSVSPSPSPSQSPSASPSPSTAPSQPPASPSVESSPEPSQSTSVDLQPFFDSLVANENFVANMPMEDEWLTQCYPGLDGIATKQAIIYQPMISAVVCEIAVVEVENASDVDAVKAIFQARIDSQVGTDDEPGGAWYPESIESWKNNSRIVSNGNYVMMIAWEYCDTAVSEFNALF